MAFYAAHNPERRFILVFSPKAGTRTCGQWFLDTLPAPEAGRCGDAERTGHGIDQHLIEPETIGDSRYADHHVAMVVRDPHRRLVSAYADLFVGRPHEWGFIDGPGRIRVRNGTFRQIVESLLALHRDGEPLQHHLEPQTGRINDLGRIDRFLPVERLDQELEALARHVGHDRHRPTRAGTTTYVEPSVELVADRRPPWFKVFGFPTPASFYDRHLYEIVSEVYRADVELHGSLPGVEPLEPAW